MPDLRVLSTTSGGTTKFSIYLIILLIDLTLAARQVRDKDPRLSIGCDVRGGLISLGPLHVMRPSCEFATMSAVGTETWRIGTITVSKIPEMYNRIPVANLFTNVDTSRLDKADWLRPRYVDETNAVGMSVHSFLVQTPAMRILVDTCCGNHKPRSYQAMSMLDTPYLDRLAATGTSPESIDRVLCTHLHFDHVGWNTRLADGIWVATFANARYVFARAEWEFWRAQPHAQDQFDSAVVLADSVWPLDDSVIDLVNDGDAVAEHVRVSTFAGHTAGHLCVWLESGGEQAVITGDVIHSPLQFVDPAWHGRADVALGESLTARQQLIEHVADTDILLLGTHFPSPSGGRVRSDGSGWRFESVQGTAV